MKKKYLQKTASLILAGACVAGAMMFPDIGAEKVEASVIDGGLISNTVLDVKEDHTKKEFSVSAVGNKKHPKIDTSAVSQKYGVTSFQYTAPYSGSYVLANKGSATLGARVISSNGTTIYKGGTGTDRYDWFDLKGGQKYDIEFYNYYSFENADNISLYFCAPKEMIDISEYNTINDTFDYKYQRLRYSYTPSKTSVMTVEAINAYSISIYDEEGNELITAMDDAERRFEFEFKKDNYYEIAIRGDQEGKSKLTLFENRASVDVTKYNYIKDSMIFGGQKNSYTYTAPYDGVYRLKFDENTSSNYKVTITDMKGDSIYENKKATFGKDGYGWVYFTLKKGQKYIFNVFQNEDIANYTFTIDPQKPERDITKYESVNDYLVYKGQENHYKYKAPGTGRFYIKITDNKKDMYVKFYSPDGSLVFEDNYWTENGYSKSVDLTGGKTYSLTIVGSEDTPDTYSLVMVVPEDLATPTPKPTKAPTTAPTQSKKQITSFVDRIYEYVLDREPEKGGEEFWTNELYKFDKTGAEVAYSFIFSPEFIDRDLSNKEFVKVLYRTLFGREPEKEGLDYWTGLLKNGTYTREDVANGFINSQEWADICAKSGIRSGGGVAPSVPIEPSKATYAFVERMYTTAMKRASDEGGKEFWAQELSNFRQTGEQVGLFFFISDEMTGFNLDDKEYINRLYATFMDREADQGGYDFWVKYMKDGHSRYEVVLGFTRSEEFVNKCIDARILPYLDPTAPNAAYQ